MKFAVDSVPNIIFRDLSRNDATTVFLLNNALRQIDSHANDFSRALSLFGYCRLQQIWLGGSEEHISWQFIAARDAVMSIFHYRKSMLVANDIANSTQIISPHVDRLFLKTANSRFEKEFPDYAKVRHGVAHAGEMFQNIGAMNENAFNGSFEKAGILAKNVKNLMMGDTLTGDLFTTGTFDGEIVHCEISQATLAAIRSIMETFFGAFRKIPSPLAAPVATS